MLNQSESIILIIITLLMTRGMHLLKSCRRKNGNAFIKLRNNYHNESLEEFVTNKNETTKIVEFKGELIQKIDPIFMDPEYKFIKAHFYSPTKQIFGIIFDTYIVNVVVLWVMTILLYLAFISGCLRNSLIQEKLLWEKEKGSD